jgi:magnesium chelatase subunit I
MKDRIGSVIRTHYPITREIGIAISDQNAWLDRSGNGTATLAIPQYIKEIVEEVARLARSSPHVNQQSGVSVRMSIANLENVVSNAERRAILNREPWIVPRVSDLASAAASSRGKLELTMTEDEGHEDKLIHRIIEEATKNIFGLHLDVRELRPIVDYFESGHSIEVGDTLPTRTVLERVAKVPGLRKRAEELAAAMTPNASHREAATASAAEFILEGLHVNNKLNKSAKGGGATYRR